MTFRSTSFAVGSRAIQFSNLHNSNILKYQEQISSGVRLQRPSDDPIAYRQITTLTSRLTELAADRQSLNNAESILGASSIQVEDYTNLLTRAKSLALQGVQATDHAESEALAREVDGLLTQLQSISEAQFGGAYLFSGTRSHTKPFTFQEPSGPEGLLEVTYHGSNRNSRAYVGEAVSVDTLYAGSKLFGNPDRGATVLIGSTGAQVGSGTDTLIGRTQLSVQHDVTSYAGGSGVQVGLSSAESDTVFGSTGTHTLTVVEEAGDGSSGTVSLNGGPLVVFTNASTDLEVIGPDGERVFVNTTAIPARFDGTVDITATGSLSIDGGQTRVPIDYSANQVVSDGSTGRFATIDSRSISKLGDDSLEFPGTANAFQVLHSLAQDLRNSRGLQNKDLGDAINRRIGELDSLSSHAFDYLGEQSTSLQSLQSLDNRINDLQLEVETQLVDVQATNIPEAILRLENSRALLQYTYSATAQISSLGLLDFLR